MATVLSNSVALIIYASQVFFLCKMVDIDSLPNNNVNKHFRLHRVDDGDDDAGRCW